MSPAQPIPDPATWNDPVPTYDAVAASYAEHFVDELSHKPFDRDLLERFAAAAAPLASAEVPVCDLGCGPGHIGAAVAQHGLPVVGIDLSPGMVAQASRSFRHLSFSQGDMTALDRADGSFAAITCFYAIIHLPRARAPLALAEMHRTLIPGGQLVLSAHGGSGALHATEMLDHPVSLDATLFSLAELTDMAESAGFTVIEAHRRDPYEEEVALPRLYLWAATRP